MTELPLMCTDNGSMVQAQHSIVLNGLSYGIAYLFDSVVPRRLMNESTTSLVTVVEFVLPAVLLNNFFHMGF